MGEVEFQNNLIETVCKMSSLFKNEWSSKKGEGVVRFFRQFYGVLSLLRSSILSSRSGWSLTSNSTNNGQVTRIFLFEKSRQSSSLLLSTLSLKVHKGRNYEEDSFPPPQPLTEEKHVSFMLKITYRKNTSFKEKKSASFLLEGQLLMNRIWILELKCKNIRIFAKLRVSNQN